jgi:hypothetical protein
MKNFAVGFYTTFVLQCLWNWFVVGPFKVSPIGYWQMYGIHMLIQMVIERNTFEKDDHWRRTFAMLYLCVPSEKQEERWMKWLKTEHEDFWVKTGTAIFGKLAGSTTPLAIGWGIHTFLM